MPNSLKVAVIGAGISGLVTARELLRENHRVTVLEKSDKLGGTWVYDPRFESDNVHHLDPNRSIVHSSVYSSLRTNLPRPLMSFSDFSFEDKTYGDPRLFPGHQEVLMFVQDFANKFGVTEVIRFSSEVMRVEPKDNGYVVEWQMIEVGSVEEEAFDAVVVCNGHHTEPRLANDIPVVVIGSGPSALDISREIATVAKEVHLSFRSSNVKVSMLDGYTNMWQRPKIHHVIDDGTVVFQDEDSVRADAILHCTGYKFHFPFLRTNNLIHVEDNRVGPLYKHVFLPQHAPRLSFVGLTYNQGVLFRLFELQSKWVALVLSAKILLPSGDEMLADVHKYYQEMKENGIPKHYTHSLSFQFEYVDWLASQVGLTVEDRLKMVCRNLIEHFVAGPNGFREAFVL